MGFLGNLINRLLGHKTNKIINKTTYKIKNNVSSNIDEWFSDGNKKIDYNQTHNKEDITRENIKKYFIELINEHLSNYKVIENVSYSKIGREAVGRDYTFGLYDNDELKALIMLTDHNCDNNQAFKNAKKSCIEANIPFINFYTHFANESSYVINRIKQNIK